MKRIIVYSQAQARAAAQAAAERQVPIILMSAPGMAGFMGPLWFKALVDEAALSYPQADVTAMLDCADEAGTALAALRCGFQGVRFSGPEEARARLADIAGQVGASVEGVVAAETLDLLDCNDPPAACRAFLASSAPD
ncbi:MAG TPA: class II fructose-bisphosphate aldolase [Stellaceae bacterium]|jgi:fructose/tagatose bisphosphate aldolase|nr:class II fructose-bisphosphate aldolase [Stellaceae bacterium]